MKTSKYNFFWEEENGKKVAFNSMTCGLAEVNDDFFKILENIESLDIDTLNQEQKELIENMKLGNFIVDKKLDELKYLKFRHFQGKFSGGGLGLTIAPTLDCNFGCEYCYENRDTGSISDEVKENIYKFAEENLKVMSSLDVTWYGGEPLICMNIIEEMSKRLMEIAEKYDRKYSAFMVTNGYLLNEKVIAKLKELKVNGIQITIDGPPEIHNNRRMLRYGKERNTFDKIVKNMILASKSGLRIALRVNIDKLNVDSVMELFDILEEKEIKRINVAFGHVTAYTDACQSVAGSCLTTEEYAHSNLEFQRILNERGFNLTGYPYYPGIKGNYCCADNSTSFVIDPKGYMHKCWNTIGKNDQAVGNIINYKDAPTNTMLVNNVKWMTWNPFDFEECLACKILPICMGGCPYNGLENGNQPNCEKWKYNLEEVLKYTYLYNTTESESAGA